MEAILVVLFEFPFGPVFSNFEEGCSTKIA